MTDRQPLDALLSGVERLHELADAAELMDDIAGAEWLRAAAEGRRQAALRLLDD